MGKRGEKVRKEGREEKREGEREGDQEHLCNHHIEALSDWLFQRK